MMNHNVLKTKFRLFLLVFLLCTLPLFAQAQVPTVSINVRNVSVKKLLQSIEEDSQYTFAYADSDIDTNKTVSVNAVNRSIASIIEEVLPGVRVEVSGTQIILKKAPTTPSPQANLTRAVRGQVIDEDGEPVVGASVILRGTTNGVSTDLDGNYTITIDRKNAILDVTFIGHKTAEVTLFDEQTVANVVLKNDVTLLESSVVVGYGVQKKVNLTGAVGVIDGEVLNNRPVTNLVSAIQGADPGLLITMDSGSIEGKNFEVSIRGDLSLNSGSPLILVDGIQGDLNRVNPNDVESVSVLKDASACAIYGATASAGVVLITTKSGSEGKLTVNYNGRYGISWNTTSTDFITNGYDYVTFTNDFYYTYRGHNAWTYSDEQMAMLYERRNDKKENPARPWVVEDATGMYSYVYLGNFDWYDFFFKRSRPETEHNISVSGGNKNINYYISGRYLYREGLFDGYAEDTYQSFDFRAKINAKMTKWLTYSGNYSLESSSYDYGGFWEQDGTEGYTSSGILWNVTQNISPTYVPYNPDGTVVMYPGFMADATSPLGSGRVGVWQQDGNYNARKDNYWTLNNSLTFNILSDLQLIVEYSYRRHDGNSTFRSVPIENSWDNENKRLYVGNGYTGGLFTNGSVYDFYRENRQYSNRHTANAYAQYHHSFGRAKAHNLAATLGANFVDYYSTSLNVQQDGSLSYNQAFINMAQGDISTASESNTSYRTLGFFGRVNYDYREKYLFEVSVRGDGSSRFAKGNRWGVFPSASVGWKMSDEGWWKGSDLSNGWSFSKIRFSYGSLGNQQVSNYYYIDTISTGQMSYTFDGTEKAGYASMSAPVSDGLTWETVTTYNLGFDFAFLNNRLSLNADLYIRDTRNMLTQSLTLPNVYGVASPKSNCANLRSEGYEFVLNWNDRVMVGGKPFDYSIGASLGNYETTITKYNNPTKLLSSYYVGQKLGEIWGYQVDGLFKTDHEAALYQSMINDTAVNNRVYQSTAPYNKLMAGDVKFVDRNGDGVIDDGANTVDNPGDKVIIGNSQPKYIYSFRGSFTWAGIDFSAFFQGVGKCDWMPDPTCAYFWNTYNYARTTFIASDFPEKTWTETNRNAYFPRHRTYQGNSSGSLSVATDRYLQNASYLRLKNLTIGYSLPVKVRAFQKFRIYVSGENLFYWSPLRKYCKTVDPEVAVSGASDDCLYPYSRTFSVGLDITF